MVKYRLNDGLFADVIVKITNKTDQYKTTSDLLIFCELHAD
jgi:hypothetical protein